MVIHQLTSAGGHSSRPPPVRESSAVTIAAIHRTGQLVPAAGPVVAPSQRGDGDAIRGSARRISHALLPIPLAGLQRRVFPVRQAVRDDFHRRHSGVAQARIAGGLGDQHGAAVLVQTQAAVGGGFPGRSSKVAELEIDAGGVVVTGSKTVQVDIKG